MDTNNPMDAFRSARLDLDVVADSSTKIPNFDALSRRRTNRRVIAGAVLALGLMIPTAASLLTSNDSPTQLVAEKGKAKKKPAKKKKVTPAPVTTAPPVVVPVVSNTGAAAELGLSATEVIRADQGFRSKRDGFGFPNYGGVPTDDAIDTTVMVALFGKANVCADPTAATCVELPGATDVKNQLNDALAAGRCEGFATLSQRFFDGLDQRPNGAKETGAVARLDVAKQISYWWATQVAPTVSTATKKFRAMKPSSIVTYLSSGLTQKTGYTLGLYSSAGGHSVSPLAVTKDGTKWNIYVYDNNYPKEIRKVVVDPATEIWTYGGASLNSTSAADTWTGTGVGTMDLTPMAIRTGPFNVSFGSTKAATKGSTYRVLVTQKPKKKGVRPAPVGAILKVGSKSVSTFNYVAAGKSPFNARPFMGGTIGVGVVAYVPVVSGSSGIVKVKPSGNSAYGDFAVSMDRPGLPALYASSASAFTMVGEDGASTDSIRIEGITSPVQIRTSAGSVSHSFELGKGFEYVIESTNGSAKFEVVDLSGKVVYDGEIPVDVPEGEVLNINHSFDSSTSRWSTTETFVAPSTIDGDLLNKLSPSTSVTTTTTPGGLDFPLRAIAAPTTTTTSTTTTTLAPQAVSVSVTGTRFYGADNSSIVWNWSCDGSTEGCAWAKARFDANELEVSVSANSTSAASSTPYSGSMSLVNGVTAPSNIDWSATVALTVEPRAVTVTADAVSKTYGDVDPELTFTTLGLVEGDSLSGSLGRATGEIVGTYAINQGTLDNSNYDITFIAADLTIDAKAVIVTAAAKSKTYGDADPTLTYTVSPALVGTDTLSGSLTRDAGDTVGTYEIKQGTLANSNYTISFTSADLTIDAKALTVTAAAKSKTYGDADPTLTYTTLGLEQGDTLSGSLDRTTGNTVGTYAINQGTLDNSNYDITFIAADLTINAKAVTVTAAAKSKTYGDADPTLTYTVSPALVGTDTLSGSLTRDAGDTVGTYEIKQGTLANSNYTISFTSADLTIDAKALTVTAAAKSKTYGDADPTLTYTTLGLEQGDTLSGSLDRTTGNTVGTYAINQGTLDNSNYDITFIAADLTINAKAVTVTAAAKSKTYGDADPTLTYATSPALINSDSFSGSLDRATGNTVGTYAINQGTLDNSNYDITFIAADLTINAKAVTVTADAASKNYGSSDPALTYTVTSGSLVQGDSFSGAISRATGEDIGEYDITQGNLALSANYSLTYIGAKFTITEKTVTVTANAVSKTYGENDPTLTYTTVGLEVGDTLSGSLGRDAGENVGKYAITQGTLDNANYDITFVSADLTIDAKAVTVTAAAKSKTYGDVDPTLTYTVTAGSLEQGDSFSGAISRATGENVGTHVINQGDLALSSNYTLTFVGANLTINAKAVTVTADAASKTYGDADSTFTYTTIGLVGTDTLSGSLGRATGENVGKYAITQGTVTNANNANYNITFVSADLTIGEKAIEVTADAASKTYGDADPTFTFSVTDGTLKQGDTLSGSLDRVAGENVGKYAITQGTVTNANNANYNITFVSADLTIGEKAIEVTADAASKTYGDADPTFTFSVTDGSLEQSDTLSGSLGRATGSAVGKYAINQGTLDNSNYDITFISADLTINAKAVTVTADAKSKTYGDVDPTLTYSVSPALVGSDTLSGSLTRDAGDTVGTYAIKQGSVANSNYTITFVSADLTISEKAIEVTANAASKTYGDADPTFTFSVTDGSLEQGDTLSGSLGRATGSAVGTYAINQGSLDNANYDITFISADLTINAKAVTVTAAAKSKTYGDVDPTLTYSVSPALVGSDTLSGSLTRDAGDTVGTYAIKQGSVANSNYTITFVGANLTIDAKAVTVTAAAKSKTYGDVDPTLTYSVSPALVGTDTLSGSLTRDAGDTVGSYAIKQGSVANSNYTITFVGANLTVNAKAVTVTVAAKSKTYGDADPTFTYSVTAGSLEAGDSFTGSLSRDAGENVGDYSITQGDLALSSNYTITFVGAELSIEAKAVTVTADAKSKTYGSNDPALTFTTIGLVGTDTLSGSLGRATGDTVGTYAINRGTVTNANNANYDITFISADLTINAKAVTVTAAAKSKTYGDVDPTLTYSVSPALVGSDTLSGSLTRDAGDTVGTYAIKQGSVANSNYTITFVGANLTIDAKAVTVTAAAKSKTYGDVDPTLTYSVSPALVGGDTLSGSLTRDAGDTVGTYAIKQGSVANSNYTITFVGANLTVNAKAVTVTADAKSKTYGSSDPEFTYSVSPALVGGDTLSGSLTRDAGDTVGTYAIKQGSVANSNYTITFVGANLTINAKTLTVTADAKSKQYGDADPGLTYTTLGLETGDTLSGALGRATGDAVGTYAINKGTLANSNYTINFVGANLTITTRAVTATAAAKSKTYGDVDPALTYTVTSGSLLGGDAFTGALTRDAGENVGEYNITKGTLALNSNYTLTFVGAKFTIAAKTVTITPVSGQTAEISSGYKVQLNVTGFLLTDTYTGDVQYTDALGDQVITNKDLNVGSNYTLSFTTGVTIKVVAQLPISLTWRALNGSVDGTGLASIGAKLELTASGGGTGALTWSVTGGGCTLSAVSTSGSSATQSLQKNGGGNCTVKVVRAASGTRSSSEISQQFTWSNK